MAYSSSAADRLTAVRASIDKVLNSQEYRNGEMGNRMPNLNALFAQEERLQREVDQASGGITLGQMTTFP